MDRKAQSRNNFYSSAFLASRKAQFFMIGTIVVAGLISGLLIYNMPVNQDSSFDNNRFLVERNAEEFPKAVSIILEESRDADRVEANLKSYMEHSRFVEREHAMESEGFLLVGVPREDGYNVTFGNFMGRDLTNVELSAGGDSGTLSSVNDRELDTLHLDPGDRDKFLVEVSFGGFEDSFTTDRKAFSLLNMNTTTKDGFWHVREVN